MFDFLQSSKADLGLAIAEVDRRLHDIADSSGPGALSTSLHRHLDAGGARVRARTALTAAQDTEVDGAAIATAVEALHQASLVHDDLSDRSGTRRGVPTIWAEHGPDAALAAGDLMISGAFAALARTGNTAGIARMHQAVARTIRGQCADVTAINPRLWSYARIAQRKSGPLLSLGPVLVLEHTGRAVHIPNAERAGRWLALAFQIADDLADVAEDAKAGRPNIIDVLARDMQPDPTRHAVLFAHRSLDRARAQASSLPASIGDAFALIDTRTTLALKGTAHAV